jgi:hypothetical protein
MRFKSTWILLAALLLIAAYFFLVDEKTRIIGKDSPVLSKKVLPYGRYDIDRFILINPQGDRIELEKVGEEWIIVAPVRTDAAQSTIDALLTQLIPGRKLDVFTDVTDLSQYGLDDPYATLVFFPSDGGGPDTLYVGDKTPTSISCYARIGRSDTVMIVREMTHNVVNKNLYHLRDKDFLYIPTSAIDSIEIRTERASLSLERMITGWRIGESGIWADRVQIETYLNDLTLAIIRGFVREDTDSLSYYGLDPPRGEISVFQQGEEYLISFGSVKDDMVHATRSGIDRVLLLEEKLLAALEWSVDDIRSRELAFFEPADITEISCETVDRTITLLKEPTGWSSSGIPVGLDKPLNILRKIKEIRFESFTGSFRENDPGTGGSASLVVTLRGADGQTIDRILFYASSAGTEEAASISSGRRGIVSSGRASEIERFLESL